MKSGYYMVKYGETYVPLWLTNINGDMWHYKTVSERWEVISEDQIMYLDAYHRHNKVKLR